MMAHRKAILRQINILLIGSIFLLLTSCTGSPIAVDPSSTIPPREQSELPDYPKAVITFEVQTSTELPEDQSLYAEFLDEVTGLALNATQVPMERLDALTYVLKLPIPVGSVIKYRYLKGSADSVAREFEYTSQEKQVRYRLYYVDGPGVVRDTISAWKGIPMPGSAGRIQGQVAYKESNSPVINALVSAGGVQTLTASDGSFIIEGLSAGLHNLVIYSLDGSFQPFQQGAVVAPESTTPAVVQVSESKLVNVTFLVSPPENHIDGMPIRMVGNILQLGNTFADLDAGVSVIASRAPLLAVLPDGRYSITMKLPAGLDLRYKYSLGDGFWNAERAANGGLRLRQLIIPNEDLTLNEVVDTWNSTGMEPVTFNVTVPSDTPVADSISIQFNPFGWTEPIPMWPAGNNHWFYVLYNPFDTVPGGMYRFCRNDQCGVADAIDTRGPIAPGKPFQATNNEQSYTDTVDAWAWLEKASGPVVIPALEISPREGDYYVGAEFMPLFHPSWTSQANKAYQNLADIGSNSLILAPTWHVTHQDPPILEAIPGKDALWSDLSQMVIQAQQKGLGVVLHPVLQYPQDPGDWWASAARDDGWWQSWFDRYRTFLLHHADLAAQTGVKALIIGDESILPALPGGVLADGSPSQVPGDAAERWNKLIVELRSRYTGKLVWFVPYSGKMPAVPEFAADLDMVYFQLSAPFAGSDQAEFPEIEANITNLVDNEIQKVQQQTNQPVLIGLKYPSVQGAMDGCVEDAGSCLPLSSFDRPVPEHPSAVLDLTAQANLYSAVLTVISQRSWITGFYSVGYYPPASLTDGSISIHGKPASDVLWYWYPRLLGKVSP